MAFIEILILVLPGLVIIPADFIVNLFRASSSVDSWTHGIMVWLAFLYLIPIIYIIVIIVLYRKKPVPVINNRK